MVGEKRKREEYPPLPCTDKEMNAIINKWMAEGVLRPFKPIQEPTSEDIRKRFYYQDHWYVSHGTRDCRAIRRTFHKKISDGTLNLTCQLEVQQNPLPQHHKGKPTAVVLFHNGVNEDEMASGTGMPLAALYALQRSPTFRSLFTCWGSKRSQGEQWPKLLYPSLLALEHTASQLKLKPAELS